MERRLQQLGMNWENMHQNIKSFIERCDCSRFSQRKPHVFGIGMQAKFPFQVVSLELIEIDGNFLLTIVDHDTRFAVAEPISSKDHKIVALD